MAQVNKEVHGSSSTGRRPHNEFSDITYFSTRDINRATKGLSDTYRVGKWRCGSTYKCFLDDTEVLIKTLDDKSSQDSDEFIREVNILKDLRHPNLPELVGACIDLRAVVYRAIPDRNLEDCLEKYPRLLTWQIRTSIVNQICSAHLFLYSSKPHPVILGDFKAEYVHLDSNFNCTITMPNGTDTDPEHKGKFMYYNSAGIHYLGIESYFLGMTVLRLLTGCSAPEAKSWARVKDKSSTIDVDDAAGKWPDQLVKEMSCFATNFCKTPRCGLEELVKDLTNFLAALDKFKNSNELNSDRCFKSFTDSEIERATNGLSESLVIGKGGYGSVYKGHLDDNPEVAIKMLNAKSSQGLAEFVRELEFLGNIRHPHIVRLIGACFHLRALVYEFLPNGSIEDCLEERPSVLTWQMRTRIIHEICSGLIFLHSIKPKPMVHGDLKPQNILLDSNFGTKLADFGLSRFMSQGTSTATGAYHPTKDVKGTEWYIDPDFLETKVLTPACDVYAFGVTILRILTRSQPAMILRKVERAIRKKMLMSIVDSEAGDWPDEVAEYLARIGLECCEEERKHSRLMSKISNGLRDILTEIGS